MRLRPLLTAAAIVGFAAAASTSADAAVLNTVADWQMNESAGASVMRDASGHGISGSIGAEVISGATAGGATGYQFPSLQSTQPNSERLVQVDNGNLNPGNRDYAVTIRFRTGNPSANLVQKGQATSSGGYFKLEEPDGGGLHCVFRGSAGGAGVGSNMAVDDGQWHTVRCLRTSSSVTLTVDGVFRDTNVGSTGSISNSMPLTIGGKPSCNGSTVECDYFLGLVDFVG